ncbi:MAG: hypothetical protein U0Z44_15480 [Kouleothrix sp.]
MRGLRAAAGGLANNLARAGSTWAGGLFWAGLLVRRRRSARRGCAPLPGRRATSGSAWCCWPGSGCT